MDNNDASQFDLQEFLKSDGFAKQKSVEAKVAIILMVAGSISFIASSAIIYHISRAHKGLSTTYHRLVFGLCIADMMSSLAYAPSTTVTPKETKLRKTCCIWERGDL